MRTRVVVTGMGAISPLGHSLQATWEQVLAGKSGIRTIERLVKAGLKTQFGGEVKDFDPVARFGSKDARRMARCVQFAHVAAEEALQQSGLQVTDDNRDRIGLLVGTGIGGVDVLIQNAEVMAERGASRISAMMVPMMLPDSAAGQLAITFGLRGPNFAVTTACATGTNALGEASELIRRGAADVMLAGGAEACLHPLIVGGFSNMGALAERNDDPQAACRPFDKDRSGFVASEGSAILVLESEAHALARGATILGEILGYGQSNDAYHISAPAENGSGAAICMRLALQNAGVQADQIDYVNAHGTSTYLNDKSETAALKAVLGEHAYKVAISSTKSMHGHTLGAAGALESALTFKAIAAGFVPPTINYTTPDPVCDLDYVPNQARKLQVRRAMKNSFGFGGHNACLILGSYD